MTNIYRSIVTVVVLLAVAGGIAYFESKKASTTPLSLSDIEESDVSVSIDTDIGREKATRYELAKEVSSPDGFINTPDGTNIQDLIGKKIILVDFWTYSCINCQRTLPYLNSWHQKYADEGLVILGVHTPEFEFEKEYANVLRAVEKFGVKYPVILDNDFSTWRSYRNQYWPRKYLIDIDGFIVYDHIGEGGYDETEEKIVELLNERNARIGIGDVAVIDIDPSNVDYVIPGSVRTPETYLGSARVEYINNIPSELCLQGTCTYEKPDPVSLNSFSLAGEWRFTPEHVELVEGEDGNREGSIFIRFSANKVNLVAGSSGDAIEAEIYLDGVRVTTQNAGVDVKSGLVTFSTEDLYNLIDLKGDYGEHILEIRILEEGLQAFAFTFG
jgi:thiol-disulfide isomerase/thioredoxin